MQQINMLVTVSYSDENVLIDELVRTPYVKELRIVMQKHQVMRDHASQYPITLSVLEGAVKLTIETDEHIVKRGGLVVLGADTMHHLEAVENTILRLTIFTVAGDGEDE